MKKMMVLVLLLCVLGVADAKVVKRPLIEMGPKATFYIGDDFNFGIGGEVVVNPLKGVGFRLDLMELIFDPTRFYLNYGSSLDGFYYFPMQKMQAYVLVGFGLMTHDTPVGSQTFFSIRAGGGLNYPLNAKTTLFGEPTLIIAGNGDTDVSVRISLGARFRILK